MKRKEAIEEILKTVKKKDIIVSACGYISRELYNLSDRERNFYMMGSMGCELAIGMGIAHHKPKTRVIVISGDGSTLMSLGTLALYSYSAIHNIEHYVLNNECYESTGGQDTCFAGIPDDMLQYSTVFDINPGGVIPERIGLKPNEITERFRSAISNNK